MEKIYLGIDDSFLLKSPKYKDRRGSFSRGFCKSWFGEFEIQQINWSSNLRRGTVRGFHFQTGEYREEKIITVAHGAVDIYICDLRSEQGISNVRKVTLHAISEDQVGSDADNAVALKIGKHVAVAFQTIADNTLVNYLMSASYNPSCYRGFNALDPSLNIEWSLPVTVMSERDRNLPRYDELCG